MLGCSEERTNSGEPIFETWERKRARHGAGPIDAGVVVDVDIVRARRERREETFEAILTDVCGLLVVEMSLIMIFERGGYAIDILISTYRSYNRSYL